MTIRNPVASPPPSGSNPAASSTPIVAEREIHVLARPTHSDNRRLRPRFVELPQMGAPRVRRRRQCADLRQDDNRRSISIPPGISASKSLRYSAACGGDFQRCRGAQCERLDRGHGSGEAPRWRIRRESDRRARRAAVQTRRGRLQNLPRRRRYRYSRAAGRRASARDASAPVPMPNSTMVGSVRSRQLETGGHRLGHLLVVG